MEFNHKSRRENVIKSSSFAAIYKILSILINLGYRTVFLRVLTVDYLGINGLFTNILGILCLAELGITNAIVYRFYKPISINDSKKVGQLMQYFKKTYLYIAIFITLAGLVIIPFLPHMIEGEVPVDLNITLVYLLFLIQTAASYLFSYKLTLLTADQKQYMNTVINLILLTIRYGTQIIVLLLTKDYTLTLAAGIGITILINYLASLWVTHLYPSVFSERTSISKEEKRDIYKDTSAAMLHKIGGTIVTSTDNILITKFIGLSITGIYSNYALLITGISGVVSMLFGSFTASLGNAHVVLCSEDKYNLYRKSLFINFWIVSLATVCLYVLIDDFIYLWLGQDLFLERMTVILLCLQFYIEGMRYVSTSYTMACGLFVRDKIRPVIEALLNIIISLIALKMIGLPGIFVGTLVSCGLTVFWREPLLLYRYVFKKRISEYWGLYLLYLLLTIVCSIISIKTKELLFGENISFFSWVLCGIIAVSIFSTIQFFVFRKDENYKYFWKIAISKIKKQ